MSNRMAENAAVVAAFNGHRDIVLDMVARGANNYNEIASQHSIRHDISRCR